MSGLPIVAMATESLLLIPPESALDLHLRASYKLTFVSVCVCEEVGGGV